MKSNKDYVVLLHGLARTANSMNKMADAFRKRGYHTLNLGYPSRSDKIENLSLKVLTTALDLCTGELEEQQRTQAEGRTNPFCHSLNGRHFTETLPFTSQDQESWTVCHDCAA